MKSILLAGGLGSRMVPMTVSASKQLLPIYDKPMIYYSLSSLMLADIREVLIISTHIDMPRFQDLFGNGEKLGISITYEIQDKPSGIADAFLIGRKFIGDDSVCLALGDNIFYGMGFSNILKRAKNKILEKNAAACIFAYPVANPSEFGVVEFDSMGKAISLEEKPLKPKSNYAIPGLYFYGNDVCEIAKNTPYSARGEREITDVNKTYLNRGDLTVINMGRGTAWLDTGTPHGMLSAAQFIEAVQNRQGLYVACLEEIAFKKKWINANQMRKLGEAQQQSAYGQYILSLLKTKI